MAAKPAVIDVQNEFSSCAWLHKKPKGVSNARDEKDQLEQLQAIIGYQFTSQQLLQEASSIKYQQLAFIGDAALALIYAEHAFTASLRQQRPISIWTCHLQALLSRDHFAAAASQRWKLQQFLEAPSSSSDGGSSSSSTSNSTRTKGPSVTNANERSKLFRVIMSLFSKPPHGTARQQLPHGTYLNCSRNSSKGAGAVSSRDRLAEGYEAVAGAILLDSSYATLQQLMRPWIETTFHVALNSAAVAARLPLPPALPARVVAATAAAVATSTNNPKPHVATAAATHQPSAASVAAAVTTAVPLRGLSQPQPLALPKAAAPVTAGLILRPTHTPAAAAGGMKQMAPSASIVQQQQQPAYRRSSNYRNAQGSKQQQHRAVAAAVERQRQLHQNRVALEMLGERSELGDLGSGAIASPPAAAAAAAGPVRAIATSAATDRATVPVAEQDGIAALHVVAAAAADNDKMALEQLVQQQQQDVQQLQLRQQQALQQLQQQLLQELHALQQRHQQQLLHAQQLHQQQLADLLLQQQQQLQALLLQQQQQQEKLHNAQEAQREKQRSWGFLHNWFGSRLPAAMSATTAVAETSTTAADSSVHLSSRTNPTPHPISSSSSITPAAPAGSSSTCCSHTTAAQLSQLQQQWREEQQKWLLNILQQRLQSVCSHGFLDTAVIRSCSALLWDKMVPQLPSTDKSMQLEQWTYMGQQLMTYAATMLSFRLHCGVAGNRAPVVQMHNRKERLQNRNHKARMLLALGLDPSFWCPAGSSFYLKTWDKQADLLSQCLYILMTAVYLDGGIAAALQVADVLLRQTPDTVVARQPGGQFPSKKLGPRDLDMSWVPKWTRV